MARTVAQQWRRRVESNASTPACHVHKGRDGMHRPQVSIDDVGVNDSISQKVMLEGQLAGGSAFCPSHLLRTCGTTTRVLSTESGDEKGENKGASESQDDDCSLFWMMCASSPNQTELAIWRFKRNFAEHNVSSNASVTLCRMTSKRSAQGGEATTHG